MDKVPLGLKSELKVKVAMHINHTDGDSSVRETGDGLDRKPV